MQLEVFQPFEQLEYHHRNLNIIESSNISVGVTIIFLLISIYLFGFLYLLSTRLMSHLIEDLVYLADYKGEETLPPIVYCCLNSLHILILYFLSSFISYTDEGLGLVMGSDMFNLGFIYPLLLLKVVLIKQKDRELDSWFFLRDSVCYLVGLILVTIFLFLDGITWWMALILVAYSIIFFFIQSKDADIKEKIFRCVGLTHEDDSFNAEDQMEMKKQREDIDELIANKFVNMDDDALKKRIARNEGMLIINNGPDNQRTFLLMRWHRAVYTVMFAVKNKQKFEKQQRSEYYKELWKQKDEMNCEEEDESEKSQSKSKSNNLQNNEEERSILEGEDNQQAQDQHQEINIKDEENDQEEENEEKKNKKADSQKSDDQSQEYEEEVIDLGLKLPQGTCDQISYIVFFPFHLFIYMLPNYHKNPSIKKLVGLFIINLILFGLSLFVIEILMKIVAVNFMIPPALIGIVFMGILISLPYMVYNLKFVQKDHESVEILQSFIQVGIYKVGICNGLPWLFNCIIIGDANGVLFHRNPNIHIVCLVFAIFYFVTMIAELLNKFRVNRILAYGLITLWSIFLIVAIVILNIK